MNNEVYEDVQITEGPITRINAKLGNQFHQRFIGPRLIGTGRLPLNDAFHKGVRHSERKQRILGEIRKYQISN